MTGVVTRDSAQRRSSDKHRSDARNTYNIADACLPSRTKLPCPILRIRRPILRPAPPRPLRPLHENDRFEARFEPDPPRNAPHSALVFENAPEASNEATVASVAALEITLASHQIASSQPARLETNNSLDSNDSPVEGVQVAFLSCRATSGRYVASGHGQLHRQRRRRVTRQGRCASGRPAMRVDSATAVAFSATLCEIDGRPQTANLAMARETLISIVDIARIHGKHRASIHRIVRDLGLNVENVVGERTRGQKASHIAVRDYETYRSRFDGQRRTAKPARASDSHTAHAVFYLILTEPELDPGRFKIGFSADLEERLRHHRTAAPFCELVRQWPCKALWEKTAIECVADGCQQLGPEVFRADSIEDVIHRADRFFDLMPVLAKS